MCDSHLQGYPAVQSYSPTSPPLLFLLQDIKDFIRASTENYGKVRC